MLRSIFNFCFWTKDWSIDHALSDKSTKRGGPKCRSAQEEWGWGGGVEGRRDCNSPPSLMSDTSWELALGKKREINFGVLFQPKYGRRKRWFLERPCCDAGKNTFTSQFVATRSISWKERLKFAVREKVLPLKWNTRAKSAVKRRAGTLHETNCCSGGYFCSKFFFFPVGIKMVELRNFL